MQILGFMERYRSALCCYTHRILKLGCAVSLYLICATQFRNRVNLAAQLRNCANLSAKFWSWFKVSKLVRNFEIFKMGFTYIIWIGKCKKECKQAMKKFLTKQGKPNKGRVRKGLPVGPKLVRSFKIGLQFWNWLTILKFQTNFAISNLHSVIWKLRIFANGTEHILLNKRWFAYTQ